MLTLFLRVAFSNLRTSMQIYSPVCLFPHWSRVLFISSISTYISNLYSKLESCSFGAFALSTREVRVGWGWGVQVYRGVPCCSGSRSTSLSSLRSCCWPFHDAFLCKTCWFLGCCPHPWTLGASCLTFSQSPIAQRSSSAVRPFLGVWTILKSWRCASREVLYLPGIFHKAQVTHCKKTSNHAKWKSQTLRSNHHCFF